MAAFPVLLLLFAIAFIGFLVWACASIGSNVWMKTVCRDLEPGKVVLTFDDGPDPVSTPQILDILAENGVHAYFFVVGEKAERYPELVRRMACEGHHVGNHTYTHSSLFPLSGKPCIEDDIRACDSVIASALAADAGNPVAGLSLRLPSRHVGEALFRPPFGVTNPDIAKAVKYTGHKVIGWDVRSLDTSIVKDSLTGNGLEAAVGKCVGRIMRMARPGSVILLHDRLANSPALLKALLERLRAEGLLTGKVTNSAMEN
ncbi:MAG: polysaccharide deacetylase family protein [Clostridium sp.]|nr:polysaccharide deacetylase family protein [Bacteroides sp.]MCM1198159.1 polysaccharide deacetylase family protein [Clostridium sp.]